MGNNKTGCKSGTIKAVRCSIHFILIVWPTPRKSKLLWILLFPCDTSNVEHWLWSFITPVSPMWADLVLWAGHFNSRLCAEITRNHLWFTWIENEWRWIKICPNTKLLWKNPLSEVNCVHSVVVAPWSVSLCWLCCCFGCGCVSQWSGQRSAIFASLQIDWKT